jgi:hypothetical protein
MSLAIPIGQPFHKVLTSYYRGYEYSFNLVGYGISDDGYSVPSLPEGLTFDERTSALYGTVNSNNVTSSNSGEFCLYINELQMPSDLYLTIDCAYCNISYYTP